MTSYPLLQLARSCNVLPKLWSRASNRCISSVAATKTLQQRRLCSTLGSTAPRVVEITIADEASAWKSLGFAVDAQGVIRLDNATIRLTGRSGAQAVDVGEMLEEDGGSSSSSSSTSAPASGITSWTLANVATMEHDTQFQLAGGIRTQVVHDATESEEQSDVHANGVYRVDHIVARARGPRATLQTLERQLGMPPRTVREKGETMYGFFRFHGPLFLEVIGSLKHEEDGTTPEEGFAQLVGLCLVTEDLDSLVASLPEEGIGAARAAVQPGRRIAPLRHKHYGISVHTAFMSPHISN